MKTLLLIRHAKSSRKLEGLQDIFRPLSSRGYEEADTLVTRIHAAGFVPELLLASPAVRTYTTALYFSVRMGLPSSRLRTDPDLFESGVKDYLRVIRSLDTDCSSAALFGHNDTISELLVALTGDEGLTMRTGECAVLQMGIKDWGQTHATSAVLQHYFHRLT